MIPIGTNLQRTKLPYATLVLICVNALFFIIEILLPLDVLEWVIQNLGYGPTNIINPIALITHMFLHGDIYHIAFNMLFLWIFGGPVEERTGTKNFLIYYFGAGIAAGILNVAMEMIARPESSIPGIGASGAISGIMALFLYRCFYSKLKLVISPILLPRQINVPVVPLILFWFFQDVIMGIFSLSYQTGIAHWAHIGGFIFGIVTGRVKRYGHEGRLEQLRERILKKLENGGGWKAAERDLLKLIEIAPQDPEVHLDLSRLYANREQTKFAEKHYQHAVQKYFITEPISGAYTVLEHMDTLSRPMAIQYHLKAAEVLTDKYEFEDAHRVLAPLLSHERNSSPIAEKGLALFIKLSRHLDRKEEAYDGVRVLMEKFPESRYKNEIKKVLNAKPGEVFSKIKPVKSAPPQKKSQEGKDAERLDKIEFIERIFADPSFWSILLFVNIAAPILAPELYSSQMSPVYLFTASFIMTVVHRLGSISDILSHIGGPSEKKARYEVNLKRCFEDAVLSEKRGRHPEAVTLYEQLLSADPKNIQARFNLARIYHRNLSNSANAKKHYKMLIELLPPEHPFRRDALDAIKELKQ